MTPLSLAPVADPAEAAEVVLRGLRQEKVLAEWERCKGWIEPSLAYGGHTHTLDDVRDLLISDPCVWLWPGRKAAAVTQIIDHPRLRQMHFWLCGGSLREIVREMLPAAEDFGRKAGCVRFSTAGRPGWRRALAAQGYAPALEVCWKDVP